MLDAKEDYIVHQCNCITTTSYGLSSDMFKKYPYANTYRKGVIKRQTGNIHVAGKEGEKKIVAFFAQYKPGKPTHVETEKKRREWFQECLNKFALLRPNEVAFPFGIGCGLAGGKWNFYMDMIETWAIKNGIKVVVYKMSV